MVLPFEDAPLEAALDPATAWRVIRPEPLPLLSWPWEWTFGELRDAALLTLDLQLAALTGLVDQVGAYSQNGGSGPLRRFAMREGLSPFWRTL